LALTSDAANTVLAAIASGRKVGGVWLHGSVSELLAHRHDGRKGTLWLTFARSDPSPGNGLDRLLHVTIDGEHI
jgi:hypothetical protein